MYGLVNKAIEDLVISSAGEQIWLKIRERAGLQDLQLLDSSNYDDEITYKLVAAASDILEQPPELILRLFGKHWVLYTGKQGWSSLFAASGDDLVSFLKNLDDMHARVKVAMPEGRMPEFTLTERGATFELEYRSERDGLAPMVSGMLYGLAEQFEEAWHIEHVYQKDKAGFDRFSLERIELQVSGDIQDVA